MRIGDLAKKYNISIGNLYYYIKLGLIVPSVHTRQYYFDSTCEKDLQGVLLLKDWGFSLKEIAEILRLSRLSNMQHPKDTFDIINIMQKKHKELQEEKNKITQKLKHIKKAQEYLKRTIPEPNLNPPGLPISMLYLLCCPYCKKELKFSDTDMTMQQIYNANATCVCGYQAVIKDGVFVAKEVLEGEHNKYDYDTPNTQREYYKDLPQNMITFFQFFYNWMRNKILRIGLKEKIILETHLNTYFYLQFQLNRLYGSKLILVDKYSEIIFMYKEMIDRQNTGLDILYIVNNDLDLPLNTGHVDIFIDFFSSNEHQFFYNESLISKITPYLNKEAKLIGTYFFMEDAYKSIKNLAREYPQSCPRNFSYKYFLEDLQNMGFRITEDTKIDSTLKSGKNKCFDFHVDGEKLCMFSYLASNQ